MFPLIQYCFIAVAYIWVYLLKYISINVKNAPQIEMLCEYYKVIFFY